LFESWREFLRGKRKRKDVIEFSMRLTDHILILHEELVNKTYQHGHYTAFKINDPKPRDIHKASVRDRLIHHAIYKILYPYFDEKFIYDSYSCRLEKGTHRAIERFGNFANRVSRNHTRTTWILKGDIRKFFASIDHSILKNILSQHIPDNDILWLLFQIIDSFHTENRQGIGLPLGNLTSQLLINIYLNEFDQFIKRELNVSCYIRYADDFVILHHNRRFLEQLVSQISAFLETKLKLVLHPNKLRIQTLDSGVDFLGWVNFARHRVLRSSTKRRMFKKLQQNQTKETVASCLGLLSHGNTNKLVEKIKKQYMLLE
jgi:retron-type reverse transcriptase